MISWRLLVLVVVVGVWAGPISGVIENKSDHVSIPVEGHAHYGFPLVWRSTDPFVGETYDYISLLADCAFWVMMTLTTALLLDSLTKRRAKVSSMARFLSVILVA